MNRAEVIELCAALFGSRQDREHAYRLLALFEVDPEPWHTGYLIAFEAGEHHDNSGWEELSQHLWHALYGPNSGTPSRRFVEVIVPFLGGFLAADHADS